MQHTSSDDAVASVDTGFFERERLRLIQDIAKGMESTMDGANKTNRKIEESISVGKEFHPISQLWSQFERIMHASGIPNLHPQDSQASKPSEPQETHRETSEAEAQNNVYDAALRPTLPPGVAPGGGKIYA